MTVQQRLLVQEPAQVRLPFGLAADAESDNGQEKPIADQDRVSEREDLPYRVELWDAAKTSVEQVLAVTANASIGYAAYYAATREHAERYITLRHKNGIISRWNGPSH